MCSSTHKVRRRRGNKKRGAKREKWSSPEYMNNKTP
jgi:hypothetical protein